MEEQTVNIAPHVVDKALDAANHLILHGGTLRSVAEELGISRQTVLNYFREVLPFIDEELSEQVNSILEENKSQRHKRGADALWKKSQQEPTLRRSSPLARKRIH